MSRKKNIILPVIFLLFLTGCGQIYNNFHESLNTIDSLVQKKEWAKASKELNQMVNNYERKHQWKDLYIEAEDYSTLVELIGVLKGAIKEKDNKQVNIQIVAIELFLKNIYYQ